MARSAAAVLADDLDRDHGVLDLLEGRKQGLEGALGVRLDDQAELLDLAFLGSPRQVLEGDAWRDVARCFLRPLLDQLGQGDLPRRLFRADDLEDVTCLRDLAHPGDHHGSRRRRLVHAAPAVVGERAHAAVDVPAHEVVPDLQRPRLHEHGGDRASAALQVGIHDGADRVAVGIRLELQDVGGQHDGGEEVVHGLRRMHLVRNQVIYFVVSQIALFFPCINEFHHIVSSQAQSFSVPIWNKRRLLAVGAQQSNFDDSVS